MNRPFEIVTLSDCPDCNKRKRRRLAQGWEIGAITTLLPFVNQLFGGSIDPGHWEGTLFIPGDLNNRIAVAQQKIALSGLGQFANQNEWMLILKTPGIWQSAIDNYINTVLRGRQNGIIPLSTGSTAGGIGNFDFTSILLVGGILWFLLSDSKKRKRA